ncbi:MAG TPA: nucleoside hydrolase [Thermoanaerobaculia bacterium]|nr:nucleoside hydrolase [Thermoanaerobaculia bacterium]
MRRAYLAALLWVILGACGAEEPERQAPELQASVTEPAPPIPVWLDVDPAIGIENGEVDDGLAMIQAFHSPEIAVRGVSVVYGNTTFENAVPIARELVERFGAPGLGVFPGAADAAQLGVETEAVRALASALERERLTVLALGPVTNVGSLLRLRPELAERIDRVVVVAGRRIGQSFRVPGGTHTPFRDFNFELDPVAMQVILESSVPLELAPWEVSSHVWLRAEDMAALAERSDSGRFVAERTASWLARWKQNLDADGFNPFDTLAVGWVTHPTMIEWSEVAVWIEEGEDDVSPGSGARKPYLLVDPERDGGRRARYAHRPMSEFQALLVDRLAGPPVAQP